MASTGEILASLRRLAGRVAATVARAVVSRVTDTTGLQTLQMRVLADETLDDVERFQQYGFTSVPTPGAEGVVLFLGGSRSHPITICVDDRRYRLTSLLPGEVCIHDDLGQKVHIERTKVTVSGTLVELGSGAALAPTDGVVTGLGIDPFTGATYFALGGTSSLVRAQKV